MKTKIELKNVNYSYRSGLGSYSLRRLKSNQSSLERRVLKDFSVTICERERVSMIGLNGSGKSTTLKLIAGIMPPDEGQVITRGNVAAILEMGIGFEEHLNAKQNIISYDAFHGIDRQITRARISKVINWAELDQYSELPFRTYSTGMKGRLAFATSTEVNPEILLLDEVLGVGDLKFAQKAKDRMNKLTENAGCLVLVTHDLNSARELTERGIWIHKGEIRDDGPIEQVIANYYDWSTKN